MLSNKKVRIVGRQIGPTKDMHTVGHNQGSGRVKEKIGVQKSD